MPRVQPSTSRAGRAGIRGSFGCGSTPGSYTAIASPKRARSASSGSSASGRTAILANVPPWKQGALAFGPSTAMRGKRTGSSGRIASALRTRVKPAAAASTSSAPASAAGSGAPLSRPNRRAVRATRSAASRTRSRSTCPSATAPELFEPRKRAGPGISRSRPPFNDGTVECVPNQSLMNTPSNVHSPFATSRTIFPASAHQAPFTLLYAVSIPAQPACAAISNGARYTSRRVRSSTTAFMESRAVSLSLHTRCFATAPVPTDWQPWIHAAPSRPHSSGSSEKYSNARPASGLRARLRFGASIRSTLRRIASPPTRRPTRCTSSLSQLAPSATGAGVSSDTSRSSTRGPATPIGPSAIASDGMSACGMAAVDHMEAPAVRLAISSRVKVVSLIGMPGSRVGPAGAGSGPRTRGAAR